MHLRDVLSRRRSVRTYADGPVPREVLLRITGGREIDWPAPYWYVDAGAAAMVLMLAAIDEGLETAIFGVTDLDALRRTLGLSDDLKFVAVVTMGYPAEGSDEPSTGASVFTQRRKPRDEVVRWERW